MTRIATTFNSLLADMLIFRQKVLHYHWTVSGQHFFQLHSQFESYYSEWSGWIDDVAERILQRGEKPIATLGQAINLGSLNEDPTTPADTEMVENLLVDMRSQSQWLRELIEQAEAEEDRPTANLADEINDAIAKHVWMLEAFLKQQAAVTV